MSYPIQVPQEIRRGNGFGVTAMVFGIIAVVLSFIPFISIVGIILGGLAVVFAITGLVVKNRVRGTSIAGLVLGIVALVLGLIFTIIVYGAVSAVDDALEDEKENRTPHDVTEGESFKHDVWKGKSGWKIKDDSELDMVDIKGLKVKNTSDSAETAFLTFNLNDGDDVVASIDCTSPEAQPGKTVRMDCVADDAPDGDWESVSVKGDF